MFVREFALSLARMVRLWLRAVGAPGTIRQAAGNRCTMSFVVRTGMGENRHVEVCNRSRTNCSNAAGGCHWGMWWRQFEFAGNAATPATATARTDTRPAVRGLVGIAIHSELRGHRLGRHGLSKRGSRTAFRD